MKNLTKREQDILALCRLNPSLMSNDKLLYVTYCERIKCIEFTKENFLTCLPMTETIRRARQSMMQKVYDNPKLVDSSFLPLLVKAKLKGRKLEDKKLEELGYNPSSMSLNHRFDQELEQLSAF